jgi:hypothetical protein
MEKWWIMWEQKIIELKWGIFQQAMFDYHAEGT